MTDHKCKALAIACIDFRFQKYLDGWLIEMLGHGEYDRVGYAGGVKNLDIILEQIEISERLHSITDVYLINHEDCGAYGEESTPERHSSDLNSAEEKILEKWPHLKVHKYYLHLDGEFEDIN